MFNVDSVAWVYICHAADTLPLSLTCVAASSFLSSRESCGRLELHQAFISLDRMMVLQHSVFVDCEFNMKSKQFFSLIIRVDVGVFNMKSKQFFFS